MQSLRGSQDIGNGTLSQHKVDLVDEAINAVGGLRTYGQELNWNTSRQAHCVLYIEILHNDHA